MEQIQVQCPHCGITLAAQKNSSGQLVECAGCHNSFTVPAQTSPVKITEQMSPKKTFTFVCPACGGSEVLPENLLGKDYECQKCFETSCATAATERPCPFCGKSIKYHASICKYCRMDLHNAPQKLLKSQTPEETFLFICPECDSVRVLPGALLGKEYECPSCCEISTAVPAEERKCSWCGEKIKVKATVCKHCRKPVAPLLNKKSDFPASVPEAVFTVSPAPQNSSGTIFHPEKRMSLLVIFNILFPGAGHIYLGQTLKGVVLAVLYLIWMFIMGLVLTSVCRSSGFSFLARMALLPPYAFIIGDSFFILNKFMLGIPAGEWEFSSLKVRKEMDKTISGEIKTRNMKALTVSIAALLIGLNGPTVLALICLFISK